MRLSTIHGAGFKVIYGHNYVRSRTPCMVGEGLPTAPGTIIVELYSEPCDHMNRCSISLVNGSLVRVCSTYIDGTYKHQRDFCVLSDTH